jgi:tRNA1Val (adenine37-N6)-methyltransferase
MAAQRTEGWGAEIVGVEIDPLAAEDARENVARSEWAQRVTIAQTPIQDYVPEVQFDHIISNPPYFVASLLSPDAARTTARHTATLPFEDLVAGVLRLMTTDGHFSLILPPAEYERFLSAARGRLFVTRLCEVWSTPESGTKRIMAEFSTLPPAEPPTAERLIIEDRGPQGYSEEYKALTRDFYLKF